MEVVVRLPTRVRRLVLKARLRPLQTAKPQAVEVACIACLLKSDALTPPTALPLRPPCTDVLLRPVMAKVPAPAVAGVLSLPRPLDGRIVPSPLRLTRPP